MVGGLWWIGFNYQGGAWNRLSGKPGQVFTLYSDAKRVKLTATFFAGGFDGKATLIRAITLTRGGITTSVTVAKRRTRWVLEVVAKSPALGAVNVGTNRVNAGGNIIVQGTPVENGLPIGATITLPWLKVRVAKRARYSDAGVLQPDYGEYLDVYLDLVAPPPLPTSGLFGATYKPSK
ncbi:hypothetical protein D9Q98_004142 [Chlorella vulgaris]|uniref:Uncharacterized protein n=1 Tax=Chlorella vulgaris TaxID=3077 RepID=A0A9D4YXU1_CHLVU|nr:hypothetical protein D9Q98_004142 [Chlorella vulgaris]